MYVFVVFKSVGTKIGSELIRSNDLWITNMRFRPLRYYSLYQPYATLRTIKHPIADYCPYILGTPPNTC